MSELGNYFLPNMNNRITNPKAVFKGQKYRISVISDMILRLEYNEEGQFNDYLTEIFLFHILMHKKIMRH